MVLVALSLQCWTVLRDDSIAAEPAQSNRHEPSPGVVVQAPEPRYVAPTQRDQIGRIWAPVLINGKGPFRLVLDTGASGSGITAAVAQALSLSPDSSRAIILRGVTGIQTVSSVRVQSFEVGDLILSPAILPIITDPLGGADGVLGSDALADMRVQIDFRRDRIAILRSRHERIPSGFSSIPLERSEAHLLLTRATVDGVVVHAIIDTGAQATIGNQAMRAALVHKRVQGTRNQVIDVTGTSQTAESFSVPPIEFGAVTIQAARITYGEMQIFDYWHLNHKPALLIGMDVIGLLDVLIIDYARRGVYLRSR
jgi:predicted aspartyl protease